MLTAPSSGGTVWCTHGELLGRLLARRLGGELTLATRDAAGVAGRLLLRLPLAAPPDEVWPDQPAYPATATRHN